MKKIILVLLLLPCVVKAASYTDYQLTIKDSDEFYEETELLKREEYYEYNTYNIKRHYLDYQENCSLYDKDDYYDTEEYLTKYNNTGAYGAFYMTGKVYEVNMKSVSVVTDIYEINIYHKNKKIPFTYTTTKIDNPEYMHDGDNTTRGILSRYANIHLYFDPVDFEGLRIELVGEKTIYVSTCVLSYYDENNQPKTTNIALMGLNFWFVSESEYNELLNRFGKSQMADGVASFYLHKHRYYHCYEEYNEPTGIYKREGNNLILDDYHIKYNYYERKLINDKKNEVINNGIITPIKTTAIETIPSTTKTKVRNRKITTTTKKLTTTRIPTIYEEDIPIVEPLSNAIVEEEKEGIFWLLYLLFLIILIILILVLKRLRKNE